MVMGSQSPSRDLHVLNYLDNNYDYWKQAMQIRCNESAAEREGTMSYQQPLNSSAVFNITQYSTDSVPFISRALQLCIALMNWHVFPELWVLTALGLSLKDKPWKAETYTEFLRLWSYLIWTHVWLASRRILTPNEGTVNVKCITSSPLFPNWMWCYSTVKIFNWFMYWSLSTLPHGQHTSTWKMVQN